VKDAPTLSWGQEWTCWSWTKYNTPREVHDIRPAYSDFMRYLRQITELIPISSESKHHGYSLCATLSIGMLIHDIDMKMGVQGGLVKYLKMHSYIKGLLLSEEIIEKYLLLACNDLKSALMSNQGAQSLQKPVSYSAPAPSSNIEESGVASTENAGQSDTFISMELLTHL